MNTCKEYTALLDPYVDGELSSPDMVRVQAHLAQCPACRSYVDDVFAIRAAFPDVEDTLVPDGFAERVMTTIQAKAVRKRKSIPWGKVLAPLAACLALVIVLQNAPPSAKDAAKTESAMAVTSSASSSSSSASSSAIYDKAKEAATAGARTEEALTAAEAASPLPGADAAPAEVPQATLDTAGAAGYDAKTENEAQTEIAYYAQTVFPAEAKAFLPPDRLLEETQTQFSYVLSAEEYRDIRIRLESSQIAVEEISLPENEDPVLPILVILKK